MVKPKVGLSMLCHLSKPFKEMAQHALLSKVKYIEVVDDGLHELNKRRVAELNDAGNSYQLRFSVHAPFVDLNIASPSRSMLRATKERMQRSLAYARDLNAYVWVFHPGMRTGVSSFYPGGDWRQNLKTIKSLAELGDEYGVKVAIENVPEPFPFLMKTPDDFKRFYAECDANVGMVLDVGHANINNQVESFLLNFKKTIVHMHLSDNSGESDQHLGVGQGSVNWERYAELVRLIRYNGVAIVESVEHVDESVRKIERLLG